MTFLFTLLLVIVAMAWMQWHRLAMALFCFEILLTIGMIFYHMTVKLPINL